MSQPDLPFSALKPPRALPSGMRYEQDFVDSFEALELAERIVDLPFAPFSFQGFEGKRRVVSYGWRYDFSAGRAFPTEPVPDWLKPLRQRAAAWAGLEGEALVQALISEYAQGAPIGWHRDRPIFQDVIGVSLVSPCAFRLRRRTPTGWERRCLELEPRSVYLLREEARTDWEHSIPPAPALRYSVTFRSLRRP